MVAQSSFFRRLIRGSYRFVILTFYRLFVSVRVVGRENLPDPRSGPLILVANHFSIFDVPLIAYWLPIFPTFYTSVELWENRFLAPGLNAMSDDLIQVNRGVVDRKALTQGVDHLRRGGWLMIFPEGGVTPESIDRASAGLSTANVETGLVREKPVLLEGKEGVAFLAISTQAPVLPIGLVGTEKILAQARRFKRTRIEIRIGKKIGPFERPPELRGRAKRAYLSWVLQRIMNQIAAMLPSDNRGQTVLVDDDRWGQL